MHVFKNVYLNFECTFTTDIGSMLGSLQSLGNEINVQCLLRVYFLQGRVQRHRFH